MSVMQTAGFFRAPVQLNERVHRGAAFSAGRSHRGRHTHRVGSGRFGRVGLVGI
jgi:hypothetical protein